MSSGTSGCVAHHNVNCERAAKSKQLTLSLSLSLCKFSVAQNALCALARSGDVLSVSTAVVKFFVIQIASIHGVLLNESARDRQRASERE